MSPNRLSWRYVSASAACARAPSSTMRGWVAISVTARPAAARRRIREVLRIIIRLLLESPGTPGAFLFSRCNFHTRSGRPRRSRCREAGGRDSLIEAVNLVPDSLEKLVSNDLLDAFSWGEIRVEPLCQIALERSISDVTDILTTTIVAGFGSGFEQLGLCHQGTDLPALPLLVCRGQ